MVLSEKVRTKEIIRKIFFNLICMKIFEWQITPFENGLSTIFLISSL